MPWAALPEEHCPACVVYMTPLVSPTYPPLPHHPLASRVPDVVTGGAVKTGRGAGGAAVVSATVDPTGLQLVLTGVRLQEGVKVVGTAVQEQDGTTVLLSLLARRLVWFLEPAGRLDLVLLLLLLIQQFIMVN